jgi:hypothetical protein
LATPAVDPAAAARAAARVAVIPLEDIRAALSVADEMAAATGDSSPLVALILQRWAELDPRAACETAMARGSGRFLGLPALAEPLKVWAAREPQAAFDWYRAQASEAETKAGADQRWKPVSSLRWIMGAWALRDATAAARAFATLTKPEEINGALTGFSELSGTAPGRTAILDAWLGLPAEHRRGFMDLRSVFQRWSLHDPAELAAWLDRSGVGKSEHTSTAQPILSAWLREDPAAARDWWFPDHRLGRSRCLRRRRLARHATTGCHRLGQHGRPRCPGGPQRSRAGMGMGHENSRRHHPRRRAAASCQHLGRDRPSSRRGRH